MAYLNTGAVIRHDINTFVLEAAQSEKLLIGAAVVPPFSVTGKAGIYPKIRISKGELLKSDNTLRASDGSYNEITRNFETATYATQDRGLTERIDDAFQRDMKRFFDVEATTAKLVLRNVMLGHEIRCAATLFNSSVFNTESTGVAYSEANAATIDLPNDLSGAIERLTQKGVVANTLVMNQRMWNRIRRAAKVQTFLYGNLPSGIQRIVNPSDLGAAFGLNVVVAAATKDVSKKGQEASLEYIWSDSYMWLGNVQGGDFANGGAARTLVWTEDSELFTTETYRDEARRADIIRVRQNTAEAVIDETAGELLATGV